MQDETPTRDQSLAAIVEELRLIREVLFQVWMPPPEDPSAPCPHPPDQRIDFGMTLGQEDWQCRICGFRTVVEP